MTSFRFIFSLFLALLAACLTVSCRSPQRILLTNSDSGRTLDLCVGDTILVALTAEGKPGYDWFSRHGAGSVRILAEKGERYESDPDPDGTRRFRPEKKAPEKVFEIMIRATGTPEEAASDPAEMPPEEEPVYMTDSKGNVTVRPDKL